MKKPAEEPVARWRQGHRHRRRPVPRWRRWVGPAVLILLVAGLLAYRSFTSEARLRRFAERWMEDFTGGEAHIDEVHFDLFKGLQLVGVRLAVPPSADFGERDKSLEARTIFRCTTVLLRLRPLSIIFGNLVVPEITATDPTLILVHPTTDGPGNWEVMLEGRKVREKRGGVSRLPVIYLRDAKLVQHRLRDGQRSPPMTQVVYAEARPLEARPGVYDIPVTKIGETPDVQEMVGRLEIDMNTLAVSGALPAMTVEELLFTASPEITRWLDVLAVRGSVRVESFSHDPEAAGHATLILRDAGLSIPISTQEEAVDPGERYMRFDAMAGTITLAETGADVNLAGYFHDSRLTVNGNVLLSEDKSAGLDGIGFALEINASDVLLPREDQTAGPAEVRFVRRWHRLKNFVEDYDGIGNVDLTLHLEKQAVAGSDVKLSEATLTLKGASGRYWRFPYRLHGITGKVHFRRDGWVRLEDLKGTHGGGEVVIRGLVGGYVSKTARLDIRGKNVALDEDLVRCLTESDQALCRRFQAEGRMDLHVQLDREDYPPEGPPRSWQSIIDVAFTEGSVCFAGFPYPLAELTGRMRIASDPERPLLAMVLRKLTGREQITWPDEPIGRAVALVAEKLTGRMHVAAGGFHIDRLCARRGDARVRIRGTARRAAGPGAALDLALDAGRVPLDDVLAHALPEEGRAKLSRLRPAGWVDIGGRLYTPADGGKVEYDLNVSVTDGAFDMPGTAARLQDASARLRLVPGALHIASLAARFGESPAELSGRVGLGSGAQDVALRFVCPHLPLDHALYEALPPRLRKVWDSLTPTGTIALDMQYDRPTPTTRPADATDTPGRYTVTVEPKDCEAVYAVFPWPLTGIRGTIVVTPQEISIETIHARHEQTELEVKGKVDLSPDQTHLRFSLIRATGLEFSEALRQAVPWRVRRLWNDAKPQGTIDLTLRQLAGTVRPGHPTTWKYDGSAVLHDVSLAVGTELTEANGTLTGSGEVGPTFTINDGKLDLPRVRVDGRQVTGLKAPVSRPSGDAVLHVGEIEGDFYGGKIVGKVEVDYGAASPEYGLSLTARGVSLGDFLNAKRGPDEPRIHAQGKVDGNLVLTGRFGNSDTRRGGGSILISEAQMFKLPMILAILQVIPLASGDDNAFQDATLSFIVDGDELILEEIDLRGKAVSMVGAGRVRVSTQTMHLILLVGSPLKLPRLAVLSEFLEGVARELMEVHVEGTLDKPTFRADIVRSVRKTLDAILHARRARERQ